ncbi:hypothetical protein PIB30_051343 [Stylosanthes scabra]|uniref:Polyprotein n=1 Tax=Stylosanthes scabra TaxID=79078 RepID=A0ABU6XFP5_9FABA|nr:hypothetical protein [Stylosanthes scabra]
MTRRNQAKHPLILFGLKQHAGETIRDYLDRYNKVVQEVNVWNQAVVALCFTFGLAERGYESGTPLSIAFIIGKAVPRYPVLQYLIPRKANTGTSPADEGKHGANWKVRNLLYSADVERRSVLSGGPPGSPRPLLRRSSAQIPARELRSQVAPYLEPLL